MYTNDVEIASADSNPFLELAERSRAEISDPSTWTQADCDSDPVQIAYWEGYIKWRDAPRKVEFTLFTKPDAGCLSKRISLKEDGSILSDGSECVMSRGVACRAIALDVGDFAEWIGRCGSDQAFALGRLGRDLADEIQVVTKAKREANPGAIARSGEFLGYRKGVPAYALLDYDIKGMPQDVSTRIKALGGFWPALVSVVPELEGVARVVRRSTSAGLFRRDTGEPLTGSGGVHAYVLVKDGADIDRFLRALHERCWMAGLGWHMLGAGGQLLERSIVDKMVGAPERLVFEGAPILVEPVGQDQELRRPQAFEGTVLDTITACPRLTLVERSSLQQIVAKSAIAIAPDSTKAKEKFVAERAVELAARVGVTVEEARITVERQTEGVLLPDLVLPFDDVEFKGCTVADVMATPKKFEGATLADPLEGASYGRCKAKIYLRSDGTPWIRSFAHGLTTYELKFDARAIQGVIESTDADNVVRVFVKQIVRADEVDEQETEELIEAVVEKSGVGKRTIKSLLKNAHKRHHEQSKAAKLKQRLAERNDPRPRILRPGRSDEWLPTMRALNEVIGTSVAAYPQCRNIEGALVRERRMSLPGVHAFSSTDANSEEKDANVSPMPAPEQWALSIMGAPEAAEMIERHVEFVTIEGNTCRLSAAYVEHYLKRSDGALPTITGISTMPVVLGDGAILATKSAMRFLTDEWLVDVNATNAGKATLIACALTIIERTLLPSRPTFFVTAGRRGGGKTTALTMLILAVTGELPQPQHGQRSKRNAANH